MFSIDFVLLNLLFLKNLKSVFKEICIRYFDRLGAKGTMYGIVKSVVTREFVQVLSVSPFFHFLSVFGKVSCLLVLKLCNIISLFLLNHI